MCQREPSCRLTLIYSTKPRKNVTLAELETMGQQQLLSLPTNAELNVEIMANGVLLGNGELVQMNDTLGVEIHEWLSESGNGE